VSLSFDSGAHPHSVRLGALLVAPYLLVGLRWLADSARGDQARRALGRSFVVVLVLVPLIAVVDYQLPNVVGGGSSLAVLGLLAFSAGMRTWSRINAVELLARWGRATLLTLLVSAGVVVGWVALIVRRAAEGRWWSPNLSGHGGAPAVAAVLGGTMVVVAVVAVWWATHSTLTHLSRRR
jgi:hypothetical protein